MNISIFDLFNIGIGPSSSHTVGPMKAAFDFITLLKDYDFTKVEVRLFGSLALTGHGHATDKAVVLGLNGLHPETILAEEIDKTYFYSCSQKKVKNEFFEISFDPNSNIIFLKNETLDYHPNGMEFIAFDNENEILKKTYFSIGGGFISDESGEALQQVKRKDPPFVFKSAAELLDLCTKNNISISELIYQNELTWFTDEQIKENIQKIWKTMKECIDRGLHASGKLPGGLNVKRRAPENFKKLIENVTGPIIDPLTVIDWVNLYALSVNEENAAGGKVVTAPTNGAAGIIPAVLMYFDKFVSKNHIKGVEKFFLAAGAIGILYKTNASISGADVGCQGEVGVACSMAAAGLAEVLGASVLQVENAAEIGMEHNLGLTCDPVGGLVQIPCIERNAMGAVKAINAARIAMKGSGEHHVSLDQVIKTMNDTGKDMQSKYKETSLGGLAVNIVEC